ncbi:MAG: DUF3883 domain-containing protein [Candidatus Izemoplasma sp.]|nr:DUF3883 domain-containing protein [Candidatus Izemoplasma sp.]
MTQEQTIINLVKNYLVHKGFVKLNNIQNHIIDSQNSQAIFNNYASETAKKAKIRDTIYKYSKDSDIAMHSGEYLFESKYEKVTPNQEFRLIKNSKQEGPQYFIVFQGKTYKEEYKEGILWAPRKSKNGSDPKFHWKNLTACQPGDIVFSIVNNRVNAKGIVEKKAILAPNPFDNDLWINEGWLVDVDYYMVDDGIKIKDHIDIIRPMLTDKYSPFKKETGNGNVGYLFKISNELGRYLNQFISDEYKSDHIDDIFEISEDEETILESILEAEGLSEADMMIIEDAPPIKSNKPNTNKKRVRYKKTDYLKKAERDIKKGYFAEKLVEAYEKNYLISIGREDLANKVKWVAKEADNFGYDILSFDENGNDKYIEVKGTTLGKSHPFDVSKNEVDTSIEKKDNYWIYRVYNLDSNQPMFYKFNGSLEEECELIPSSYKAYIKE